MRNTISAKYIKEYIEAHYDELRHNPTRLAKAIRIVAKDYDLNKKDLFHYLIERDDCIPGATSYGFDTRYGRELRSAIEGEYYSKFWKS
jgi:hypothetical protein